MLADALLNMIARNAAFSSPAATIYVALLVTTCAETYTTMAEVTEAIGTSRCRVKVNQPAGVVPAFGTLYLQAQTANAQSISLPTPGGEAYVHSDGCGKPELGYRL